MSKELKKAILEIESSLAYHLDTDVIKYLKILKQALTPPTSAELCEALSVELKRNVLYYDGEFEINHETLQSQTICFYEKGYIYLELSLPPHLITLIGRFYESIENPFEKVKRNGKIIKVVVSDENKNRGKLYEGGLIKMDKKLNKAINYFKNRVSFEVPVYEEPYFKVILKELSSLKNDNEELKLKLETLEELK